MLLARFAAFSALIVSSASSGLSSTSRISICSNSCIVVAPWQREVERRAFVRPAFGPHAPAVARDDALHEGEADAGAREVLLIVQSLEDAEKLGGIARVEACAIVAYIVGVLLPV